MKTKISILLLIAALGFGSQSCKDGTPTTLNVKESLLEFTHESSEKHVTYSTNASSIAVLTLPKDDAWCSISFDETTIKVSVTKNTDREARNTTFKVSAGNATPKEIRVEQKGLKLDEKKINSFIIKADKNSLQKDIVATIDETKKLIEISTNEWIGNVKELIVDFDTPGTLFVNDTKQVSGVNKQSFLEDLVYTVKDSDGSHAEYKVVITGPMFTGIPVVSIFIDGGLEVVEKTKKLPSKFHLAVPGNTEFDMSNIEMTIRGRGNTTWGMPKKPYRVDFPSKTSLFGLPAAKKWVFLANYQDPTLLMNDIVFELGRRFGLEFNHSSIHVEMFINGTYRGNYQMTEQKEVGKGRVDINTDNGFLIELDSNFDEDYKFYSEHFNLPVMVSEPSLNNESEMEYIMNAFHEFEETLYGDNFPSTDFENHIDVNSLINFMLINEFVRNQELHWPKSTYMYKNAGEKIKWGPLWDFDWAFGYNEYSAYFKKNDLLFYAGYIDPEERPGAKFFSTFFEIPYFKEKYYSRWKEVRPIAKGIMSYIDTKAKELQKSQEENFKLEEATPITKNAPYEELISQMKEWLENRIEFLDSELAK